MRGDDVGDGEGEGEARGVGRGCGVAPGPNGVANGITGNVALGVSPLACRGGGVTMAIVPLGRVVSVASMLAGITDPAPSTKFFPLRKI